DIALDLVGRRAEHHVTRGTSYRIQRIDQRHTGCKGGRQGAGETRYRRLVQNVTHHRHLQHQPVEPVTEFLGTCVRLLEGKGSTNKPSQHYVPPSLQCLRQANNHHSESRQLRTEVGEHILELRNHLDQKNGSNDHCHQNYRNRIVHCLLDLGFQRLGFLLISRHAIEQGFQRTGLLPESTRLQ